MKKVLIFTLILILTLVATMVACAKAPENEVPEETTETDVPTETETKLPEELLPELGPIEVLDDLIAAYCEGTWDGSFIANDANCASIQEGRLWVNCSESYRVPDMGPYNDSLLVDIISTNKEGTWTYDSDTGVVELWSQGYRLRDFDIPKEYRNYSTILYHLDNCIVVRCGELLKILDLYGYSIGQEISGIVDTYQQAGKLLYSTFEHNNYSIDSDGNIKPIETHYVRFPRKQGTVENSSKEQVLTQCFNLYCGGSWDGSPKVLDTGEHVRVDYDGNIIVNNTVMGNVSLGTEYLASSDLANNIYLDDEVSYWLDGSSLVRFRRGEQTSIDIPDGDAQIEWLDSDLNVVIGQIYGKESNTLFIVREGELTILSEKILDANVAYDTLYYMEGDTVFSLAWEDTNASPEVFVEGAFAVSPHTDEAEGAIVPEAKSNCSAYGYNLYSPYGRGF